MDEKLRLKMLAKPMCDKYYFVFAITWTTGEVILYKFFTNRILWSNGRILCNEWHVNWFTWRRIVLIGARSYESLSARFGTIFDNGWVLSKSMPIACLMFISCGFVPLYIQSTQTGVRLWLESRLHTVRHDGDKSGSLRKSMDIIQSEEYGYYTIGSDWKWMISIIHFTGYGRILSAFTYTTRLIGIGITTLDEQYRMNTRNDEPYMATLLLLWKRSWKQSWYTWICMYITTSLHSENW